MLEYDPDKRVTAQQALTHEFFRSEPVPASLSNGSEWDADALVRVEKEPSASHAEPAEAAVLPKAGKPGSSQVRANSGSNISVPTTQQSYVHTLTDHLSSELYRWKRGFSPLAQAFHP